MASKKHTHKYRRLKSQVWACGLPDCTHYIPKNMEETIENKLTICWSCERTMSMDVRQLNMDKPICTDCILKLAGINIQTATAIDEYINTKTIESGLGGEIKSDTTSKDVVSKLIDPLE